MSLHHNQDKVIAFERGSLLFVFNFHPTKSFEHYRIGTRFEGDHELVLDSDEERFGGHSRLRDAYKQKFPLIKEPWCNRPNYI